MPVAYGLLEPVDLSLARLDHRFEGLRIVHISDLHVHQPARWHQALVEQLARTRADMAVFTGDYAHFTKRAERYQTRVEMAVDLLGRLAGRMRLRFGCFGVFGNHDGPYLRDRVGALPIRWLRDETVDLPEHGLRMLGLSTPFCEYTFGDPLPLIRSVGQRRSQGAASVQTDDDANDVALTLMLCHMPTALPVASDLGADVMFTGHSHGGQIRLPNGQALINKMDFPLSLTSGILRHRRTLAGVSRGLGSGPWVPRFFAPPHVPIYTLHRNSTPGRATSGVECIHRW
ncbi:MAG: metallophosphoesterase [Rhodospirillales bacterium]|nr:metallophosphoesterase [Rhodospirillales bacterium]